MDFNNFVDKVKALGVTELLEETTKYDNIANLTQLYAVKDKRLLGSYSPVVGGMIFKKASTNWSMSRRTFKKTQL